MVNRREAREDIYAYDVIPTSSIVLLNALAGDIRKNPPKALPARTLIVYSKGDRASSPSMAKSMADKWGVSADSRMVLTKSNHHVFHDYEREQVIETIVRYCQNAQ